MPQSRSKRTVSFIICYRPGTDITSVIFQLAGIANESRGSRTLPDARELTWFFRTG